MISRTNLASYAGLSGEIKKRKNRFIQAIYFEEKEKKLINKDK